MTNLISVPRPVQGDGPERLAAWRAERGLSQTQAAALLGLYVLGFLAALGTARLLKSTILRSDRVPFMMELPPWRWPSTWRAACRPL